MLLFAIALWWSGLGALYTVFVLCPLIREDRLKPNNLGTTIRIIIGGPILWLVMLAVIANSPQVQVGGRNNIQVMK